MYITYIVLVFGILWPSHYLQVNCYNLPLHCYINQLCKNVVKWIQQLIATNLFLINQILIRLN